MGGAASGNSDVSISYASKSRASEEISGGVGQLRELQQHFYDLAGFGGEITLVSGDKIS